MSNAARAIHDALTGADLEYSAYSCNGVNLFGDHASIKAATTAFHHAAQVDEYARNLRHWREECGKLHAKIAIAKDDARVIACGLLHDGLDAGKLTPKARDEIKAAITRLLALATSRVTSEESRT